MYRERVNEKLPTEYLLHEFDELISCKSLGSYNCCEMVSIYLCQREKEMPDNVYTIFVFETRPNVEKSSERLLKKLKSITDTYSLGIRHRRRKVRNRISGRGIESFYSAGQYKRDAFKQSIKK